MRLRAFAGRAAAAGLALLALSPPSGGETLATVGGRAITEADVSAFYGYLPRGEALREATAALVERETILALARGKALTASPEEVARAVALAARAQFPPAGAGGDASRRFIAEEILVAKYIDLYIYPRVKVDEKALAEYFVGHASSFVKRPPRGRAALEKIYPKYRNEVLYRYVKREIERLLAEAGNEARAALGVEIRI
jgi:hypothetical protein